MRHMVGAQTMSRLLVGAWLAAASSGCAEAVVVQPPEVPQPAPAPAEDPIALGVQFDAEGWNDAACARTAAAWRAASERNRAALGRPSLTALYNAGIAFERCRNDAEASRAFSEVLALEPTFHRAQAKVTLYAFEAADHMDLDGAIAALERVVRDVAYQSQEALVSLAVLQMKRHGGVPDDEGASDMDRARLNLQRALAIDDGFMPAYNQLAVYYLARAREQAGDAGARVVAGGAAVPELSSQSLDMASLVVTQALRRTPGYAPLYNTRGLVARAGGDLAGAAEAFKRACALEPRLFEAQMNYASVNLELRGFKEAEKGYREAVARRPRDFEAHLGLALALRGQLAGDAPRYDALLAETQRELAQAKSIDPDRPETYFNQAILALEFEARGAGDDSALALEKARDLLRSFVAHAGDAPEYADASRRAAERISDIEQITSWRATLPPSSDVPRP